MAALSAETLHERGLEQTNKGRYTSALKTLAQAAARAHSNDVRARVAGTTAYLLARTGRPDEAEALCREALETPDGNGLSEETKAVLYGQLGTLALERGDFDHGLDWLDIAIGMEADGKRRGNMLINRSVAATRLGRLTEARLDLDKASATFATQGEEMFRAIADHNSGYISLLEGDLVTALQKMTAARAALSVSAAHVATCDLDRAEVLREAGLVREAEDTLAAVARAFGANRMPQARAEAEFQLARSLLTHDPARARAVAAGAARRFERLGAEGWAVRAEAVRLRAALAAGRVRGRHAPAPEQLDDVARRLEAAGFPGERDALRLTQKAAEARAGRVVGDLPRPRRRDPLPLRLLGYEARAARAAARGRDGEARRHAADGLHQLVSWQASFGALDMLSSVAMHANGLLHEGLEAAKRSRRPEIVFEWSERARHFSQQVSPVRPPPDPELAADLAELRRLSADAGSDAAAAARIARLRDQVRDRQWSNTVPAVNIPRVSLEELRAGLDAETALVTFVFSRGGLTCLTVPGANAGPPTLHEISWPAVKDRLSGLRAELDVSASVRSGPLAQVVRQTLEVRLTDLSDLLVRHAMRTAGDPRRVVVTAPGALVDVPWAMLPALRGRSVTLTRSASRWVSTPRTVPVPRTAGFAVGPGVARGPDEARAGARAWVAAGSEAETAEPRVLAGEGALVAAVTELAGRVDVLHVAAHGRHAPNSPLLSGFELADGPLFGYDIDLIPRAPETVVLSACELGRSSVRWGEEAVGMARAWLHAGTRCVIAAPVAVADDVASDLLGALHRWLAGGLAPADALAAATAETGHIAPFLCHGSGF
ncbi:CHAT domain-containing protein [Georgenia deserti]|uniref:CHAT domain-containing protein n=1 Tax=Georgenia deserti TaxID=2093781 RepID=A0ABW4L8I8_9MICO